MNKPLFEPAYEDSEESSEDDGDKGKLNTKKTLSYKTVSGTHQSHLKAVFVSSVRLFRVSRMILNFSNFIMTDSLVGFNVFFNILYAT